LKFGAPLVAAEKGAATLMDWILPFLETGQRELFLFSAVWASISSGSLVMSIGG
jgi:hypothetical protein